MTPYALGTSSPAPWRLTSTWLAASLVMLAGAACARPRMTTAGGAKGWPAPTVTGSATHAPQISATHGSPRPSPTRASPTATLTLADYLAMIPKFPPAPPPVAVLLPHGTDRAAWVSRIPTSQPVAFLTIDDGVVRSADAMELMRRAGVPVTLFLTTNIIGGATQYFATLEGAGAVIENHTVSHPHLTSLSYDEQHYQLCEASELLARWYGRRPVLFRPPYGEKNDDTLRAAWACGLKVGFFWSETVHQGKVRYQTVLHQVQPGDIILMHFRPAFAADFTSALRAIKAAGLTPALLENYVDVGA